MESPFSQNGVWPEGTQNVVGTLDQGLAGIMVTGLGYAELRVAITGLESTGPQAEICADITAPLEAVFVGYGQDEGQGADRTNSRD